MNWVLHVLGREKWTLKSTELKKSMVHVVRTQGGCQRLEFTEHEGLGLRVSQGWTLDKCDLLIYFYQIHSEFSGFLSPIFYSVDLKSNTFYVELSHQHSLGTSPSIKLPSIVRGISICISFHMSICQVKMCQAPCSFKSSMRKLKQTEKEVRDMCSSPFLPLTISAILVTLSTFPSPKFSHL